MRNSGWERVEDIMLPAAAWHTAYMACHQTPIQPLNCSFLDFANLHKMQVSTWRWFEPNIELTTEPHSFVITIERVSMDSRGAAPWEAFGLTKDTCGQTTGMVQRLNHPDQDTSRLTSGMTTCLGVVHNECQRLRRGLLLQPEPSMIWVIGKIIHLSNRVGDNSICGNQILGVDWATVTQGEGTIFKQRI